MKLGLIITQADPESVFNALRLALYSLEQGDQVRVFLSGKGVDIDKIEDPKFDVKGQARKVLDASGEFLACGACLKLRDSGGSEICPLSTLKDQYEIVRDSDKVIAV
jgi:sulfur relay (sulfurtransferase) complex TusBCD TusD component (DsrE family)